MADFFDALNDKLTEFIRAQKVFFVGTAAADSRINVSPKGLDSLRVLGPTRIVWLNLTGSGNETAAHVLDNGRMTLMFCAFDGSPLILRVYGRARAVHPRDAEWAELAAQFDDLPGARQFFDMTVESAQTSCGWGVPLYEYQSQRETLVRFSRQFGQEKFEEHWRTKNAESIDGLPTGIV